MLCPIIPEGNTRGAFMVQLRSHPTSHSLPPCWIRKWAESEQESRAGLKRWRPFFIRSVGSTVSTVSSFHVQVSCCLAFPLLELGAFPRIETPFCSTSYDYSHAEDLGPRPAEDRGPSQRRRRQGEGVRRRGGRGAPRGGGGRRQGGLEGNQAHTDGGSVTAGPQGPRGVGWS